MHIYIYHIYIYILWLHILYFHIYRHVFLFVLFRWTISDSTFTWVPSKARSSPDFLIIARTDARTTLGVKPVVGLSKWIYTDRTYDTAFLSDVVICDALFHHFSIFFQCFIISFIFFGVCQPGGQLEASLSLMCMNEHEGTSLRTFPIFVARPGGSLTTCPCICSCRGWYSLRGSARVGGAHRGEPRREPPPSSKICGGKLDLRPKWLRFAVLWQTRVSRSLWTAWKVPWERSCWFNKNLGGVLPYVILIPMYCHLCFYVGFTSFWYVLQIYGDCRSASSARKYFFEYTQIQTSMITAGSTRLYKIGLGLGKATLARHFLPLVLDDHIIYI